MLVSVYFQTVNKWTQIVKTCTRIVRLICNNEGYCFQRTTGLMAILPYIIVLTVIRQYLKSMYLSFPGEYIFPVRK